MCIPPNYASGRLRALLGQLILYGHSCVANFVWRIRLNSSRTEWRERYVTFSSEPTVTLIVTLIVTLKFPGPLRSFGKFSDWPHIFYKFLSCPYGAFSRSPLQWCVALVVSDGSIYYTPESGGHGGIRFRRLFCWRA